MVKNNDNTLFGKLLSIGKRGENDLKTKCSEYLEGLYSLAW